MIEEQQGSKPTQKLLLSANAASWISPSNFNQSLQEGEITVPVQAHPARQGKKVVSPLRANKRVAPLLTIISIIMIIVVLVMGIIAYLTNLLQNTTESFYRSQNTATITITLGQEILSNTFNLTATLSQTDVNIDAGIIAAQKLSSAKSALLSGKTTGQNCVTFVINWYCQQAVAQDDINNLDNQIRPIVKLQIEQDLHQQEQAQDITLIGDISETNDPPKVDPTVGTVSNTVTVTVSLQGIQEYIKTADARTVAAQMLQKQLKPNYTFVTAVQADRPVVQSVDGQGTAQIKMAAGGVIRYTIPQSDISEIQKQIAGKSQEQARTFIAQYLKLDPNNISIDVRYGNTLPENAQRITVDPRYPSTVPPIQLPAIPTPTASI